MSAEVNIGPAADAVMASIRHAGAGPAATRLGRLGAEFAGPLSAGRIYVRLQGAEHFITADPDDTLLFPCGDPRSGRSRYRWEDRGDGVRYGYLLSDG